MMMWELAGPVEFSGPELAVLLLAVALTLIALPALAAGITYLYYRRRAREAPIVPSPLQHALIVFVLVLAAQIALAMLWDLVNSL